MRKKEFLRKLEKELSHLDRDEREDILDYYDELIEDTIDKTGKSEGEVVYDLGEIDDIVRRVDPSYNKKIFYDEEERSPRRETAKKKSSADRTGIGIVLLICLFPLWIVLFSVLFSLLVAIVAVGVGVFAGGIVCIWYGCTLFASGWEVALFRVGMGIILIGIILIIAPLLFKIVTLVGKLIIDFFKWLFGGRRRYA